MRSAALAHPLIEAVPAYDQPHAFEAVGCLLCGARWSSPFISAQDDLTGRPGTFRFVRCENCHLIYQSPRLTIDHIKPFYDADYLAHRRRNDWGWLTPVFAAAMNSLDREKLRIVERYVPLDRCSAVLDVGCGAGTFLDRVRKERASTVAGVDFVDLSRQPALQKTEFHHGLFYDQNVGTDRFDVITMWHFLEHDYDPLRSLSHAREALKPDGRLIVEVPRLDSVTFRLFGNRWPGLQAPQHTALYNRELLLKTVSLAGLEVVDHLPYGAFPPYFYLFCGVAFKVLKGRGLNFRAAIYPYFAGQLVLLPGTPAAEPAELRHADRDLQEGHVSSAHPLRIALLSVASLLVMTAGVIILLPVAAVTLFRARRLYGASTAWLARFILRLWGIRLVVHQEQPFPRAQTVYISNHTSTLDLFVLVALALPNTRFFLSGFLRKYIPLGILAYLMGTFFTVPQDRQADRVRIFQRADRILRKTRESVYLSPEGGRITTGEMGHFNKGSFHLATSLKAPIVPMFLYIPPAMDPGMGFNAKAGSVHVYVKPAIETGHWRLEDLERHKEATRDMFVRWNQEIRGMDHAERASAAIVLPTAIEVR